MTNISISIDVPSSCRSKNHHQPITNCQCGHKYVIECDKSKTQCHAIDNATHLQEISQLSIGQ